MSHAGLANLIIGREVVPELIQDEASPENIARHAVRLLVEDEDRRTMQKALKTVRERLGSAGASDMAAGVALRMIS